MRDINISTNMIFYLLSIWFLYFRYIRLFKNIKKLDKIKECIIIIFGIYIIKVISIVFFPIVIQIGNYVIMKYPIIWLNPIDSWIYIVRYNTLYGILYNIIGNLVLLFPLPIFLIYFYKEKINTQLKILLICLLVSIGIEFFQYIESILISGVGRFIETNDVILNTSGGVLGYLFYNRYLRKLLNR